MKTRELIMFLAVLIFAACSTDEMEDYESLVEKSNKITFVTQKKKGESICLSLEAETSKQSAVWIDWNNNKREDVGEKFNETLFGQYAIFEVDAPEITIYGEVTALYIPRAKVERLEVSKNPALEKLYCSENNIKELDLSKNVNLKELDCSENSISSLELGNNLKLEQLSMGVNPIRSVDVSRNLILKRICVRGSQIENLNLKANANLEELNCSDTNLKSLDVSENTNLKTIFCYGNHIQGESMTAFMNSLPQRCDASTGFLYLTANKTPRGKTEKNVFTNGDINIGKNEKCWRVIVNFHKEL